MYVCMCVCLFFCVCLCVCACVYTYIVGHTCKLQYMYGDRERERYIRARQHRVWARTLECVSVCVRESMSVSMCERMNDQTITQRESRTKFVLPTRSRELRSTPSNSEFIICLLLINWVLNQLLFMNWVLIAAQCLQSYERCSIYNTIYMRTHWTECVLI